MLDDDFELRCVQQRQLPILIGAIAKGIFLTAIATKTEHSNFISITGTGGEHCPTKATFLLYKTANFWKETCNVTKNIVAKTCKCLLKKGLFL